MEGMEVNEGFNSFEEFEKKLNAFCNDNNVQYTVTDSKTTLEANKKVKLQYDSKKFKFRFIRFECKHGPKNKKKKHKGHGIRPNQRYVILKFLLT